MYCCMVVVSYSLCYHKYMTFEERFNNLNDNQKKAVQKTDGPLLVIAGPGTGKTELLSMRAAEILKKSDVLPSNILCLTFTDSGAINMRQRLSEIIGEDAYKVAIHTFHSFGVEIINQNREFFFRGHEFKPADEVTQYQLLRQIFDNLSWDHPLVSKNGDDYANLRDVKSIISEFKKSGLSGDELRTILADNKRIIDLVAEDIATIFEDKISKKTIERFAPLAEKVANISPSKLPSGVSSYSGTLALSLAHAVQEAVETGKTKPITAWKNSWCEKNIHGKFILKDAKHFDKLIAAVDIYDQYEKTMNEQKLFDFDDMILSVIKAVENHADLRANLQERFQYMMVDEFQDTNLAQLRLMFALSSGEQPNVMAVGDDDQAIFSFQGADIGNIQRFREYYQNPEIIVLNKNYRSVPEVLELSRNIITQSQDRLENTTEGLSKILQPKYKKQQGTVSINRYPSPSDERSDVAKRISTLVQNGTPAEEITIIARNHHELVAMLPYLQQKNIPVNYERRDNALEHPLVELVEKIIRIIVAIENSDHNSANALMPEVLAHPALGYSAHDIWSLSLNSWRNRTLWLESMLTNTTFQPLANWLIEQAKASSVDSFETIIDRLIGSQEPASDEFNSPIFKYYFSANNLQAKPDAYLDALEALRTIRDKLREHFVDTSPKLRQFLSFVDLYRQLGANLTIIRHRADHLKGHVNLMTAHKSKGQEFLEVFVIGSIDGIWGEKVSSRSRMIRYPANLPLQNAGNNYSERIRLFYVAATRARDALHISYSASAENGKDTEVASFLSQQKIVDATTVSDIDTMVENARIDWYGHLVNPITNDLRTLLASFLDSYKLSATHLNNFIDLSRGGPQTFLINNLLRFPQTKSAAASYGTAIHSTLQQLHDNFRINKQSPNAQMALDIFDKQLKDQHLSESDFEIYRDKGHKSILAFLEAKSSSFSQSQATELNFSSQGVIIDEARLAGALDLVDIDKTNKTIFVTDYKTGKPSRDWQGKSDYEKIKLHKYRQQLMFYQLLIENSRDYSNYQFLGGALQFVEPEKQTGEIIHLEQSFSREELEDFRLLIVSIWRSIINLELPDTSNFDANYKGILEFEKHLIDLVKTPLN